MGCFLLYAVAILLPLVHQLHDLISLHLLFALFIGVLGTVEECILRGLSAESPIGVRVIFCFNSNASLLWYGVINVLMCGDCSKIDLIHQISPLFKFLLIDVIILLFEVMH